MQLYSQAYFIQLLGYLIGADDLTAELFNAHYKDKQPLIVRRGASLGTSLLVLRTIAA